MRLHTMKDGINMDDVAARHAAEVKSVQAARVALHAAILDVLSRPGVKCVTARGYTPEWNDGEECEHSQYVYINHSDEDVVVVLVDGIPRAYSDVEYLRDERPDWPWAAIEETIAMPRVPETGSAVGKHLEAALGTNWCLYADETGVYVGPYDCGY